MTVLSIPYAVCPVEVRRYLGFRENKTQTWGKVEDLIDQYIERAATVASPAGLHRTFSLGQSTQPHITALYSFPDVASLLHSARQVSLLAVTLGAEIDDEVARLFAQEKYTEAAILDAVGSAAAEQAMEFLYARLRDDAHSQGFSLSRRFSPGYASFELSYQETLCGLLGTNEIGLTVTPHSMLVPRKSVTAITAWVLGEQSSEASGSTCAECTTLDCLYRRSKGDLRVIKRRKYSHE